MSPWMIGLMALAAFFFSRYTTGKVLAYALNEGISDVPTERGLHVRPTPRGGGLSLVITFAVFSGISLGLSWLEFPKTIYLLMPLLTIALVSWIDDRRSLPVKIRFAVQFLCSLFVASFFEGNSISQMLFIALILTYLTNAYNFMDGIDGIAGAQSTYFGLALLYLTMTSSSPHQELSLMAAVLFASSLGFLCFNWQPAKIFMGDVGSTFLGLLIGILSLWSLSEGLGNPAVFLILMGSFLVDTLQTLFVRLFRGVNVTQAHRDHAYQHAVLRGYSHQRVVLLEAAINLFWLFPMALWANRFPDRQWAILTLSYAPLILVATLLRAGFSFSKK